MAVLEAPILDPVTTPEDADDNADAAHIVTQADLIHSQVTGEAIRALCGKMWVPKRNPDDYALCQRCVEVLNSAAGGGA